MDKKVLAVSDLSCFGQCSLSVALPIISAAGVETCILPMKLMSTHSVGFDGYFKADVSEEARKIIAHWKRMGVKFDVVLLGYLGSVAAVKVAKEALRDVAADDAVIVLDPAMADEDALYPGLDGEYIDQIRDLCSSADFILPNVIEARLLTNCPVRSGIDAIFDEFLKISSAAVVITGIVKDNWVLTEMRSADLRKVVYNKYVDRQCHGAGDVFASAFTGALAAGLRAEDSMAIANDFVAASIASTLPYREHWYGLRFEPCLAEYVKRVGELRDK